MNATIQYIKKELDELYPNTEIEGFTRIIIEAICRWNFTEQVVKKNEKIGGADFEQIKKIVLRLKEFEPIQYILGETEFYGLKLNVDPSVLIPRPETEELVEWIIKNNLKQNCSILDIGTGSGCIALALKNHFKQARISGIDISEKALEIASRNGIKNGLNVHFFQADILSWVNYEWENFNVIVSNPPYIREQEKPQMHANVLNHEPSNALFVSDSDPLVFYKSIATFANKYLSKNGRLYFEINENMGLEMNKLLHDFGFSDIEISKDINGKDRMVCCRNDI